MHRCPYEVSEENLWSSKQLINQLQSLKAFNVTEKVGNNATLFWSLPNGIYKHHVVISDRMVNPENKFNFTIFLESKFRKKNFLARL